MTRIRSDPEIGSRTADPSAGTEPSGSDVQVRPLRTNAELEACVNLQRRIWGIEYGDIVPASIMKISQGVGGVAVGAFADGGEAVGFVFGLTGIREGRPTHWSHMLGVLKEHRGKGVGHRLKLAQRAWLLERGVLEVRWTFDPLVSGNAHFNLDLLDVEIESYVPEMYGNTGSGLHSFGTDRFIVRWDLSRPLPDGTRDLEGPGGWNEAPVLASDAKRGGLDGLPAGTLPQALRIEIPRDIIRVNASSPARALAWRVATREAFLDAWGRGYRVGGFRRSGDADTCHYLLLRGDGASGPQE